MSDSLIRNLPAATKTDGTGLIEVTEQTGSSWASRMASLDTALGVTVPGRALLSAATQAAGRTALGLGTASTQATGAFAPATHTHTSADISDFVEAAQDVVGAMVAGAGGTYNDTSGTIGLPSGSGSATPYGDAVAITDAATVTPNAALLTSPASVFTWTLGGSRTLNKPTGVPTGKAQRVEILVKQDSTGGRTLTLGTGISPSTIAIDPTANAVTRLTLETSDGGSTFIVSGGGTNLAAGQTLGTDQAGNLKALTLRKATAFGFSGAPASGDAYRAIAPYAGVVRGARGMAAGTATPTVTGTVAINGTAVTGLAAQTYGAGGAGTLVAATAANTFAAGDVITFTHTASPGGTVTGGCVSVEVEQTA
ncbi:hypothetical protein [Roseomonas indoligenes]|uniref:Uncharacterized protein n=1 Tax=Roseomonas indoligenes TaxID=2820811 RepID=A0A940S4N0_9PROT|nr:hypothetical protein [Pararoseomonas indoligenes]MBP0492149.1 hypothetical protein [Pararoseomonas indoligenes]